jgi:hypothetical protein
LTHESQQKEGRRDYLGSHGWIASQRQWKKGGWVQKANRTGYFGEENWEGDGPPYKPTYISLEYSAEE